MELHLIEKSKPTIKKKRKGRLSILHFNMYDKRILPSKELAENCDMSVGTKLVFAFDRKKPNNVFFCTNCNAVYGCILFQYQIKTEKLVATSASIVNHIQHISKAKKSVSYLVARKPVMIDGRAWYKLLTNKPYHIN